MSLQGFNRPGDAGNKKSIKNIQSIESSIYNTTSMQVSISPVNIANTIVLLEIGDAPSGGQLGFSPVAVLTNANTVTVSTGSAPTGNIYFKITVIEFLNVKSLQSGSYSLTNTSGNITINPVNTAKSLVFARQSVPSGITSIMYDEVYGILTSPTKIKVIRNSGLGVASTSIIWQVIEFL